jgi:hypothetical protein
MTLAPRPVAASTQRIASGGGCECSDRSTGSAATASLRSLAGDAVGGGFEARAVFLRLAERGVVLHLAFRGVPVGGGDVDDLFRGEDGGEELAAIWAAISITKCESSACSTTWFTRPMRRASSASTVRA